MRDLTARLRDIVRQDHGGARPSPVRDFTYVPDTDGLALDPERAARALGGVPAAPDTGCIVIDRVWEPHDWHGRHAVRAFVATPSAPLGLFDPRAASTEGWARRIVFFDLETTGLSGGAGTLAFLAGCGWFEGEAFRVRQFFLSSPAGERAMLAALAQIFDEASLVVTYNGRTFDMPLMETRWAFHRTAAPTDDLPHFDMLPPARRLWGRRDLRGSDDEAEAPETVSCSLTALERSVLGFHRVGDVPGFEIPARYFHFLRTGDGAAVMGVLDHNRHDLLSLAGVMSRALQLAEDGPDGCRDEAERARARPRVRTRGRTRPRDRVVRDGDARDRSGRQAPRARAPGGAARARRPARRGCGGLARRAGHGASARAALGARPARGGSARDPP